MATFLALPPELGGTTYGPFHEGTIAVGTDPERCQLVLNPDAGLLPVHVWISPVGHCWSIQPAGRGAVFLRRGVSVAAVTAPVQAYPGDVICLVRDDGVRFILRGDPAAVAPPPVAAPTPAETPADVRPTPVVGGGPPTTGGQRRAPTAGQMANEAKRQAGVAVFSSGPLAFINQVVFRGRTGALLQPRYVVGAVVALFVALFSGCSGLAGLVHLVG